MSKDVKRIREVSELKAVDRKLAKELLNVRFEVGKQEKEITKVKDEANKSLMELIDKYAIDSIVDPEVGTATIATRASKSLDTDMLIELLIDWAVELLADAEVKPLQIRVQIKRVPRQVKGILEKATTEKISKPFVTFKPIAANGK